jgi:phosphoglycerate dehydrogenase-like enzyme
MPEPITIVIPGDDPAQLQGTPQLERLRTLGRVVLHADRPADAEEKVRRAGGATVLVNSRSAVKWPGDVLRRLPDLRLIALCGIGTDAVDLAAARELGIAVCNVPGRTAPIVAEHALALMFAVARRAWYQTNELKSGRWTRRDNVYLRGKTLGVVGTGPIGAEVARLGHALGMRVVAWTFRPTAERAAELGVAFLPLHELLRSADIVSLHVKLTERTRRLLGEPELALMKPGALLINTARGAVVDEAALAAALNAGRLGGAGIDVYEAEPPPTDSPLLTCEQVVLTPHNADQTPEGTDLLNDGVVENVAAFLAGRPQNRVV